MRAASAVLSGVHELVWSIGVTTAAEQVYAVLEHEGWAGVVVVVVVVVGARRWCCRHDCKSRVTRARLASSAVFVFWVLLICACYHVRVCTVSYQLPWRTALLRTGQSTKGLPALARASWRRVRCGLLAAPFLAQRLCCCGGCTAARCCTRLRAEWLCGGRHGHEHEGPFWSTCAQCAIDTADGEPGIVTDHRLHVLRLLTAIPPLRPCEQAGSPRAVSLMTKQVQAQVVKLAKSHAILRRGIRATTRVVKPKPEVHRAHFVPCPTLYTTPSCATAHVRITCVSHAHAATHQHCHLHRLSLTYPSPHPPVTQTPTARTSPCSYCLLLPLLIHHLARPSRHELGDEVVGDGGGRGARRAADGQHHGVLAGPRAAGVGGPVEQLPRGRRPR